MKTKITRNTRRFHSEKRKLTIQEAIMIFGKKKVEKALEGKYFHELESALASLS